MFNWNKYPSIRLLIPFVVGILAYIYLPVKFYFPAFAIIIVLLVLLLFAVFYKNIFPKYSLRHFFGVLLFITFIFLGYSLTTLRNPINRPYHCNNYYKNANEYIAIIAEAVKVNNKYIKTIAEVKEAKVGDSVLSCKGKILLFIQRDSVSEQLNYGDKIFFHATLQSTQSPKNPEQYNYQKYLQNNGISHQAFVKEKNWMLLERRCGNIIKHYAIDSRDYFLNIFKENQLKNNEFAVAAALILGYDDFIENELIQAYSTTGIIHIICVSGMHVGLVYFIISLISFPLKRKKWSSILQTIIIITTIWFYSAITGLAPSIVRAATMFTVVAVAKTFNRNTDIYNTLALSAIILLWINPFYITNLGFILSFFAVVSIVALEPLIYNIWEFRWNITDKIWKLIAVSLAAQIGTFPLCIYLFHQFPNYFLISNLIAVPTASVIIYSGIGLLILSPFHFISVWLGKALTFLIEFLNCCITYIEKFPFATINNISITFFEMLLIYFLIIAIIILFIKPSIKRVRNVFVIIAILLLSISWRTTENIKQKMIVVYHHNKNTIIDFICGKKNYVVYDTAVESNKNILPFICKNFWVKHGINETQYFHLQNDNISNFEIFKQQHYFQFFNTTITYINFDWRKKSAKTILHTDILVIDKHGKGTIQQLTAFLKPRIVVFTASCSQKRLQQWKEECQISNIPFYDINEKGAFVYKL